MQVTCEGENLEKTREFFNKYIIELMELCDFTG